ncbi:MAG TPA: transporter substrate-binding domain-containing protein [bacterium]|nr:transporter substrate-binding domain-containing protein [bacterium]
MRWILVLAALLVVPAAAWPGPASPGGAASGGGLEAVKRRGALIVAVKADFPPFGYIDGRGQLVGFDVDLAHEVARLVLGDAGKVKLITVTSANRIRLLQADQVDAVIASMTITRDRKQAIDFSVPYFCSGHLILVGAAGRSIHTFRDLNGHAVATVRGATGDDVTRVLAPRARRIVFDQNSEAVLALKRGRADAFVQDDVLLLGFAKQDPSLTVVGWPPRLPGPYGVGVRKGDRDLLAAANVSLARLRASGVYGKMVAKWFGDIAAKLVPLGSCPPDLRL